MRVEVTLKANNKGRTMFWESDKHIIFLDAQEKAQVEEAIIILRDRVTYPIGHIEDTSHPLEFRWVGTALDLGNLRMTNLMNLANHLIKEKVDVANAVKNA